jgi:CheY-like chemotaxis protein
VRFCENILIVEDEKEWRGIYERAAGSLGSPHEIRVATDKASGERLIEAMKFAVAVVDIGLDGSDDRNVDGVRVMEKIRTLGDETSIVVVTGRSGQDVLQITRDALMKYGAYDTVAKNRISPADIRQLIEGGLVAYREVAPPTRLDARDALSGELHPWAWDDRATRVIGFRGDMGMFYDFLRRLFDDYLPLVPHRTALRTIADPERKLLYGLYWSRAIGAALSIFFGASAEFESALMTTGMFRDSIELAPIRRADAPGVRGEVFAMKDYERDAFEDC